MIIIAVATQYNNCLKILLELCVDAYRIHYHDLRVRLTRPCCEHILDITAVVYTYCTFVWPKLCYVGECVIRGITYCQQDASTSVSSIQYDSSRT